MEQTLERITPFINGKKTMLDVGSGEGWSQEIARQLGMSYAVIEPMEELHPHLASTGAVIASRTIGDLSGQYDFIVFRHVLEHLLEPKKDLQCLAASISNDGIIYIALPDFNQLVGRKGYRTNSLRPVHVSYFTMDKLLWLLSQSGLTPLTYGQDGELWAVATKGKYQHVMANEFSRNIARIKEMVQQNLKTDRRNIRHHIYSRVKKFIRKPTLPNVAK